MEVNESNFKEFTGEKDRLVVLDFWAEWCGPCRMIGPVLEKIAAGDPDFKICKVNVDEEPELAKKFNVEYDEAGQIGKRYRRQDEIGTPFCITFDFDSLEDNCVTVRDRDTMAQERVNMDELVAYLEKKLEY